MTEALALARTYKVHRDTARNAGISVRHCYRPECVVEGRWRIVTFFPGGKQRSRQACLSHACEWARRHGIKGPA